MAYRVELSEKARKAVADLPTHVQKAAARMIDRLAGDPRLPGHKKLSGFENIYRAKFAKGYRVIHQINDDALLVLVIKVGHRKHVYR